MVHLLKTHMTLMTVMRRSHTVRKIIMMTITRHLTIQVLP